MAKGKKRKVAPGDVATNRYASYRYDLTDRVECGVVLAGTEVKSLRSGTAQIKDGYAQVRDGELWLHNVHIPPYGPASRENHDPDRPRKLLAHKREIERMVAKTQERGLTLVPTRIYFNGPHAKVEIVPRPNTVVCFRRPIICFIQFSSEYGERSSASTFTAW